MRAVRFSRFGGPEVLEIVDLPAPVPSPGQVRISVRAAGVNASDWKKRQGLMDQVLPQTMGYEAAGIVDLVGTGVDDIAVGDRAFGFCTDGAAQAEEAVLSYYASIPPFLDFETAAALPSALETAARALRRLGITKGVTLLVNGASGNIGSAAVQLAVAHGARVIGTASPGKHDFLRSLGAEPIAYGRDMVDRVRAVAPGGVERALDVAGNGILPELVDLTGSAEHVVTIADPVGAKANNVHFSRGEDGRALHVLTEIGDLVSSGRFKLPAVQVFPLADVAEVHRIGETGRATGKLVLVVNGGGAAAESGRIGTPV